MNTDGMFMKLFEKKEDKKRNNNIYDTEVNTFIIYTYSCLYSFKNYQDPLNIENEINQLPTMKISSYNKLR